MSFAYKKIRELRTFYNLSQAELAEKLNVKHNTICDYEKGKTKPDTETLIDMANFFNISLDYFYEHKD